MEDYLSDRETLERYVDTLIEKALHGKTNSESEFEKFRNESIDKLQNEINMAIFRNFTKEQNEKFNQLLDDEKATSQDILAFFDEINLDVKEIIRKTMENFGNNFIGGNNA